MNALNLKIIAQLFGIAGFLFAVCSFQTKKNRSFFVFQGLSGLMFFFNYLFMGTISAALFNFVNLIRGVLLAKKGGKVGTVARVLVINTLYTICFLFSLTKISGNTVQIFLSALTYAALFLMTVFMGRGNGKHIRYFQFLFVSPAWLVHNIINFTVGGILCETFNMLSVVVSFIRYGKDGFEK